LYLEDTAVIHVAERGSYTAHSQNRGLPVTSRAMSTGSLDHVAFAAENYDDVLARIESSGMSFHKNNVPGGRLRQLFVTDPNGVKIELNFRASA
jgi:predicted enzyme related to lactoylglutathione lyase